MSRKTEKEEGRMRSGKLHCAVESTTFLLKTGIANENVEVIMCYTWPCKQICEPVFTFWAVGPQSK
jgi:hypothetical protein